MRNRLAHLVYLLHALGQFATRASLSCSLLGAKVAKRGNWQLALTGPTLWVVLFQGVAIAGRCQTDQASSDTVQASNKPIRNSIYAGVGGYSSSYSINYEISWGSQRRAWGVAIGGLFRNVSDASRAPMSSIHTWQAQVNRMPVSRAGFEYGAGLIFSSGPEATEKDTGYPQRLFLGVKPVGLRIQFKPRGIMVRLYGLGLVTLHEFNSEWQKKLDERNDRRAFGAAMFFPLSGRIGLEIGYTF